MKIKLSSVYVDDQAKALRFYTEVLGFAKKADFSNGPYRWLTVASPEEPDGTELQLALNNNPTAQTYQQAIFQQSQPADHCDAERHLRQPDSAHATGALVDRRSAGRRR
jgi:catechol 2,3-dioxygenase-like lactoylglutathione lyase family enzyme